MKPRYHVYFIDYESYQNTEKLVLTKIQEQEVYDGFSNYSDAEEWIKNNSNKRQVDITILPVYRHP